MPPPHSSPVGAPASRVPLSRRNVAVVSHAEYVLTVTAAPASRVKAAVSKAAWWPWPLTFWPWKWYPSYVCFNKINNSVLLLYCYFATSVAILVFLGLSVLDLGPMNATDRRQTSEKNNTLCPRLLGAGHDNTVFQCIAVFRCALSDALSLSSRPFSV